MTSQEATDANLSIHSWAVIHWFHPISIHAWWCCACVSLLRRVHLSACIRTASLLHALSLLHCGILATWCRVSHRTSLHPVCKVGTIEHLAIHGTEITVGERTQILADMCISVTLPDRLICIHLQTILANRRQMYGYELLHTQSQYVIKYCHSTSTVHPLEFQSGDAGQGPSPYPLPVWKYGAMHQKF